ncbi:MAG: DNA-formamidopyrimidine glycosylase family protein [Balneolaceae bacterium]|nr:DNA-formamidopyrimidine glycosylase family protein [Balneolaceae bacterium]
MPELPDVEVFKRYIDSTSLHHRITDVSLTDFYILKNIGRASFEKNLEGQSFEESYRHGKYLFLKMSGSDELLLHFGMTGYPKYYKNEEEKPEHARLILTFDNDYHLAYDSQRKLGEVRIVENHQEMIDDLGLGPDAHDKDLDAEAFQRRFDGRRGMIKSALMNQEIIAGIGNVYSDEILFQAKLHPKSKVPHLSDDDWKNIHQAVHNVCETAIDCNVEKECFPDHFILSNREEGADCPKGCDATLRSSTVSGRTAYYCPQCQTYK